MTKPSFVVSTGAVIILVVGVRCQAFVKLSPVRTLSKHRRSITIKKPYRHHQTTLLADAIASSSPFSFSSSSASTSLSSLFTAKRDETTTALKISSSGADSNSKTGKNETVETKRGENKNHRLVEIGYKISSTLLMLTYIYYIVNSGFNISALYLESGTLLAAGTAFILSNTSSYAPSSLRRLTLFLIQYCLLGLMIFAMFFAYNTEENTLQLLCGWFFTSSCGLPSFLALVTAIMSCCYGSKEDSSSFVCLVADAINNIKCLVKDLISILKGKKNNTNSSGNSFKSLPSASPSPSLLSSSSSSVGHMAAATLVGGMTFVKSIEIIRKFMKSNIIELKAFNIFATSQLFFGILLSSKDIESSGNERYVDEEQSFIQLTSLSSLTFLTMCAYMGQGFFVSPLVVATGFFSFFFAYQSATSIFRRKKKEDPANP